MAGGANAINMWFDRDIDDRMTRTRLRPIPSGRISPTRGAALRRRARWPRLLDLLASWSIPLSAWLALGGLLFYVLVYTICSSARARRTSSSAARPAPSRRWWAGPRWPDRLDLAALYLFAIIFYWTPPHFWALALLKQGDYAKAGVPMMPVVHGEHWTKVQMLVYTLILLPLTILPSVFGALGLLYAVAAACLGGRLLWYCFQLLGRSRCDADRVEDVPVLPALPGPALRGHGRRPRAAVRASVSGSRSPILHPRPSRRRSTAIASRPDGRPSSRPRRRNASPLPSRSPGSGPGSALTAGR